MIGGIGAYCKKNWFVLSLLSLTFIGFVLATVSVSTGGILPSNVQTGFMGASIELGYLFFFLGITVFLAMGLFGLSKRVRAYAALMTGILASLFMLIALIHVIDNWEDAYRWVDNTVVKPDVEPSWARFIIFPVVIQFIVFGLFTLLFGIQRVMASHKEVKAEEVKPKKIVAEKEEISEQDEDKVVVEEKVENQESI